MKQFKTFLIFYFLILAFTNEFDAQVNTNNIVSGLSEGFTVSEMENILKTEKVKYLKKYMEKNNYVFKNDDGESLEYYKNSAVSFYVYYEDNNVTGIISESSP